MIKFITFDITPATATNATPLKGTWVKKYARKTPYENGKPGGLSVSRVKVARRMIALRRTVRIMTDPK